MEVFANKKNQQVYRLSIDGIVDAKSFADIVWAGVSGVNYYLPAGVALYFGDQTKSFRAFNQHEKDGNFVAMTANGYAGRDKDANKFGDNEKHVFEELAKKIADENHAGYYVGFVDQNEELTKKIYVSDLIGNSSKKPEEM